MQRFLSALLLSLFAAGPAAAEWVFIYPQTEGDIGTAMVMNAQGHSLTVGCGNSGEIMIHLWPDLSKGGDNEFTMVFPGERGMLSLPLDCGDGGCRSTYTYTSGAPWTERQKSYMIDTMRREPEVSIYQWRGKWEEITKFTLKGSTAALGQLQARAGDCIGL